MRRKIRRRANLGHIEFGGCVASHFWLFQISTKLKIGYIMGLNLTKKLDQKNRLLIERYAVVQAGIKAEGRCSISFDFFLTEDEYLDKSWRLRFKRKKKPTVGRMKIIKINRQDWELGRLFENMLLARNDFWMIFCRYSFCVTKGHRYFLSQTFKGGEGFWKRLFEK